MSAPLDTPPFLGSLASNALCSVNMFSEGTYTAYGIIKLCEALKGSAVTSLNLTGNAIGVEGGSALAAVLKETMLTNLNLSGNGIRDQGTTALAAILNKTKITDLDLSSNELCDLDNKGNGTYTTEGITKLCEALEGMVHVRGGSNEPTVQQNC